MKALAVTCKRENWERTLGMELIDAPAPSLDEARCPADANKVLIKPRYAGFCGSDRGIWFRHAFKDMIFDSLEASGADYRICGHELLGEVTAAGSIAARVHGYKPGDMVTTESHIFCGLCHQCRIGDAHVCANHLIIGISMDGCFAESVKLPAKELWRTDINVIRPEVAAVQEPLGNAAHACGRVDLRGRTLAIFGCGTIGLFAILVARAMGAGFIVGVDPNPHNLRLAERLGADLTLTAPDGGGKNHAPDEELAAAIRQRCFGEGVDVAMEMAGSNRALNTAIAATRAGGDVILFGISAGDYVLADFQRIIMHGKTLHSVVGRRVFQTWYVVDNLLRSRGHGLQDKIYDVILNRGEGTVFPFNEYAREPFAAAIGRHPKIVFKF